MKVYRYLSETELKEIINGNIQNIGCCYEREKYKKVNTHRYKSGVKYLHFFKNKNLIYQIRYIHRYDKQNYYICEFDIPIKYLIFNAGIGKYASCGYDNDNETAIEFIVEAEKLNPKWLINYKKDEQKETQQKLLD